MALLLLQDPLVGDVRQQGLGAQEEGALERLRVAEVQQAVDLDRVHLARQGGVEPHAQAIRDQVVGAADRVEGRADAPEGAAQGPAGAGVQHAGPEAAGQARPRVGTRVEQQVRQEGPRLDAADLRHPPLVHPHRQPAEDVRPKHGPIMRPAPGTVNAAPVALTVP